MLTGRPGRDGFALPPHRDPQQAVSEGAPVLLINPATPGEVRLLWTGDLELP